jgi:hypothetical protein
MEQIVGLLRQVEVLMSQGKAAPVACREAGISQQIISACFANRVAQQSPSAIGCARSPSKRPTMSPLIFEHRGS